MTRFLRGLLLTSCFTFGVTSYAQELDEEVDDPVYLDGFVGVGGSIVSHLSEGEQGTRQNVRVEFARIRKWIAIDLRVGFGQDYTDFGGNFRVFKHIRFTDRDSATGLSLGMGLGGMYSQGQSPKPGDDRQPFADIIVSPFARFIWDWGNGVGMGFDLEYQAVPYTTYMEDTATDNFDDIRDLRHRIMFGVSFLFEVE